MSSDPFCLSRVVCLLITYILETMFENNFVNSVEWIKDCLVLSNSFIISPPVVLMHTCTHNSIQQQLWSGNKVTSIHDKNHYTCKYYKRLAIQSIIQYISEKKLKNEGKLRYKKLDAFKHGSNWMHVNDSPEGRIKCQLQTPRHKIEFILLPHNEKKGTTTPYVYMPEFHSPIRFDIIRCPVFSC